MRDGMLIIVSLFLACGVFAMRQSGTQSGENPFLVEWRTPFGMPPFHDIRNEHFLPAYQEAIARQRREVEQIAGSSQPAGFANTVEALDASGELLDRVSSVFSNLMSAETSDRLQAIAKEVAPLTSALQDDILMNDRLFARVRAVWEQRDRLHVNLEQRRLIEETYKRFVRGGARLGPEQKKRMRAINEELSILALRFSENLLKETNAFRLVIERREDLSGLPETVIAAAADAARASGSQGKWIFTLQAPSIWPFMTYADNRELRRQIHKAYITRAGLGDQRDNKAILLKIAGLRAEKARLLGYATHADLVLEERMAKTPETVYKFLDQIWKPALQVAGKEAEALQAMIRSEGRDFGLESWDWWYYAEKVKKARYDLDENEVRQYLKLDDVRQGAFDVANKLYGLEFEERADLPKYHAEVRVFEVKDADGTHLGIFMTDYHPRPGKRGGAWSSRYRGQHFRAGRDIRPIVVNVCNFTRPTGDTPALLSLDEAQTLFHEFGHGLHSLLSRIHYQSLARVPQDFVELPSQIMENWAMAPEVMKTYARHWKTGQPIPDGLAARIKQAEKFNQGFITVEYTSASLLDMDWHTIRGAAPADADAFERASLERIRMMPQIVVRYRSPYFQHIFAGGYSAGYYSYIWSEVLDSDAFQAFKEKGLFDSATARSFRTNILEKGSTEDAMEMFKRFRGREPSVEPLLEKRGLRAGPNLQNSN